MNALAAIAAAVALKISKQHIVKALNDFEPVKGRLNIRGSDDSLKVIDDTYNANPASLTAGINVLKELPGEHWLVLGDMGELGGDEERLHRAAGSEALSLGLHRLLAVGKASRYAVESFGENAKFFENKNDLVLYIQTNRPEELGVLVKGSRFMHMEQIVELLIEGKT